MCVKCGHRHHRGAIYAAHMKHKKAPPPEFVAPFTKARPEKMKSKRHKKAKIRRNTKLKEEIENGKAMRFVQALQAKTGRHVRVL